MASESKKRNIVIVGGGIIGATTAYFVSHHEKFDRERDSITLLEATKIAGGASGKAGGLLALWAYPSCIVPLSYRLHKELADKHNGAERWGYRAVHCGQVDMQGVLTNSTPTPQDPNSVSLQKRSTKAKSLLRAAGIPKDLDWLAPEGIQSYEKMGDPSTTAQVHPYLFTTSMAALAEEKGAKIVFGTATRINQHANAVSSVTYTAKDSGTEHTLPADTVILTAGPWTPTIYPSVPVSALRAHSITIRPARPVSAYCLFTSIDMPHGGTAAPEIYARPNDEVYACGEGDTLIPLPASTDLVACDEGRCADIAEQVRSVSAELRDGEVTARQACYLPNVRGGGGPLVGATRVGGLLVGTGHTCWGIQNGPGTGKCLSEIVWEGSVRSAEVGSLSPGRFM